ncbi:hypothetical protein WJX75_002611 [Coccomyxa subellipsoidea]|uniref:RING-type E3 ubiquitin transferase n=1 Tax=Coccomyxa subellipsoidea TaxID=248742 RepID=A0ABR2YM50_9CHLO
MTALKGREAAEILKAEGNAAYQKQKYGAALDRYTEAILMCPDWPVLFINRALCQKQKGDWEAVERDSRRALELQPRLMKGHYFLGQALHERKDLGGSIKHLTKALELAREQGDAIRDQIWRELAKAKYSTWEVESATRRAEQVMLKERLTALLQQDHRVALSQAGENRGEVQQRHDHEVFREPVITPSGLSYEQSALQEHLNKASQS